MNTRPQMCSALEWASDAAEAKRLQALRWSVDAGWHSDQRVGRAERATMIPEAARRIAATLLGQR